MYKVKKQKSGKKNSLSSSSPSKSSDPLFVSNDDKEEEDPDNEVSYCIDNADDDEEAELQRQIEELESRRSSKRKAEAVKGSKVSTPDSKRFQASRSEQRNK